jgi:hypothetical protein
LLFKSRLVFFADSTCVRVEFQVRNPQAAHHPGVIQSGMSSGTRRFWVQRTVLAIRASVCIRIRAAVRTGTRRITLTLRANSPCRLQDTR